MRASAAVDARRSREYRGSFVYTGDYRQLLRKVDEFVVLTSERILLAVAAFGVFMFVQRKQRKVTDRYMQNLQQRRNNRVDEEMIDRPDLVDMNLETVQDKSRTVQVEEDDSTNP